jgi:hypothetical protein
MPLDTGHVDTSPYRIEYSARMQRAAAAEYGRLARQHERASGIRDGLLEKLATVEAEIAVIENDQSLLRQITPSLGDRDKRRTPVNKSAAVTSPPSGETAHRQLTGPSIRHTAVKVLLEQPVRTEALHYRQWFGLVKKAGYEVVGKLPEAVFLTQINRSPVITRSTEPGVYALDRMAVPRLESHVNVLQARLDELYLNTENPSPDQLVKRGIIGRALKRAEKELEEAYLLLGDSKTDKN